MQIIAFPLTLVSAGLVKPSSGTYHYFRSLDQMFESAEQGVFDYKSICPTDVMGAAIGMPGPFSAPRRRPVNPDILLAYWMYDCNEEERAMLREIVKGDFTLTPLARK